MKILERRGRRALVPLILTTVLTALEAGVANAIDDGLGLPLAEACPLCDGTLKAPVVPLDSADVDRLARGFADANERRLALIDSLYGSGALGRAGLDETRRRAQLLGRLATLNCYRLLAHYACDSTRVYEASETTLAGVFRRYTDPSLIAIASLHRLRLGLGRACARYEVSPGIEGKTALGSKNLPYRSEEMQLGGRKRRVLSLKLPTGTDKTVDVLLARHYSCVVEHSVHDGPPAPYELFLVDDIQGGWLRKWGLHRPTAFMYWVSAAVERRLELPPEPLVGVRIYIPRLHFCLPSILPDINLEDLREIELPQPIVTIEYLLGKRFPGKWLETDGNDGFEHWVGHGKVPPGVRLRFPDQ
jgi:hypothetical protein